MASFDHVGQGMVRLGHSRAHASKSFSVRGIGSRESRGGPPLARAHAMEDHEATGQDYTGAE